MSSPTISKPVAKKNELKIFKTRKEVKEAENEGDKTSPANGPTRQRTPLVHTKRVCTTTNNGCPSANGIVRKSSSSLANKANKEASPEGNTPQLGANASKAKSRLTAPTSKNVVPKVAAKPTPATTRRKSLLPTTTTATAATKTGGTAAAHKTRRSKAESINKEESSPSPAKVIEKKAKSLSPVKGLRRVVGSANLGKKLANSAEDLTTKAGKKLSNNTDMRQEGDAADGLPTPNKSSKPAAQGSDSEERVSQTIHMEKKHKDCEGFAQAIFQPKPLRHHFSDSENKELANKSRETAGDERPVAANSRDLFVYINPHKMNASATLTLNRSKAKKLISNSTSDLDKKPTKQVALECSKDVSNKCRSVSTQQLDGKTASSSDLLHAKFTQLKKSEPFSEEDLSDSLTSSTLTYAIDGIGSCRTLPKFPRDSPPLSVHQEEEADEHQSGSTDGHIVGKLENKTTTSSKLADKLSKSFFDLTQGSQDRLQKWKSKLQKQCGQHQQRNLREREKDTSEPPPRNRKMCTLGGAVPASSEMEILVDWTNCGAKPVEYNPQESAYSKQPRPLRSTHSASNAMNLIEKLSSPADLDGFKKANKNIFSSIASSANPLHKSNSLREPYTIRSIADVKSPVGSPTNYSTTTMEHRTLRQREQHLHNSNIGSTASKNFQQLLQSIEGYSAKKTYPAVDRQQRNSGELPPPARIMPFSGIKPQDDGIIHRPIAFRPVANGKGGSGRSNVLEHRQSVGSEPTANFSISNSGHSTAAVNIAKKGVSSTIEQHKQTLKDHSRSIGNLVSATVTAPSRPGNNNANRSCALQIASTGHSASSSHLCGTDPAKPTAQQNDQPKAGNEENDYDTVPEFIDQKCFSEGDSIGNNSETYSLIYPYQNAAVTNKNVLGKSAEVNGGSKQQRSNGMFQTSNSTISSRNTSSHSSGSSANNNALVHSPLANKKAVNGSQQQQQTYRHSGGVHITPSPSDSGIVDYETLIRDKENELSTVRHAMEQNEEVLIRVYQEKERQFKEQIGSLKQKLHDTQQHESTLYQQLCQSDDIRQQLQNSVRMLTEDRNAQQRKCQRMEKELDLLRNKLDNLERLQKAKPCPSQCVCDADSNSVDGSVYENGGDKNRIPVPAPRTYKDVNGPNQELRSEVDDLRVEICTLRDQLNSQIHFFTDERRRWEQERQQQQNLLQTSASTDLLPNVVSKSSKPTALSALYGAPYKRNGGEVIMSTDRLI